MESLEHMLFTQDVTRLAGLLEAQGAVCLDAQKTIDVGLGSLGRRVKFLVWVVNRSKDGGRSGTRRKQVFQARVAHTGTLEKLPHFDLVRLCLTAIKNRPDVDHTNAHEKLSACHTGASSLCAMRLQPG